MKSKNNPPEVIEIEAEEIPLDKVIDTALVKQNVTQAVIDNMKKEYGGLKLKSIDDKEGYLEIKEAKKNVRKVGILVEKICKKGREDAIAIQKKWLSKESEILGKINEVQEPLEKEMKKYEDEELRKEQEEIQRKENAYMQRQSSLLKLGASYANGCIILDDVTYDTDTIKQAEDDFFDEVILPKYQRKYEIKESVCIAEDKRKEEEAEKLRIEREALEKEKKEMEDQRRLFQQQKDEAERAERLALEKQNRLREEEQRRVNEEVRRVNNERLQKLMAVMPYNSIDKDMVFGMSDEAEFNKFLADKTVEFEAKKKEDEEKRLAQVEIDRKAAEELAVKRERERVENERIQLEQKRIAEEAAEVERLVQASDKMKLSHIVEQLNAITFPEMKSPVYKTKVAAIKKKIQEAVNL